MSDKRRKFIGFVLYWGIVLFLCWIGVRYVLLWLLPFLIALGLAYLMEPSVCFLREKLRLRQRVYIVCTCSASPCTLIFFSSTNGAVPEPAAAIRPTFSRRCRSIWRNCRLILRRSGNDWSSSVLPVPRACNPGWSVRCQMAPSS